MSSLSLVKTLSHLREEKRHVDEVELEAFGLSLARGAVTEVTGGPSTGKTSIALSLLAKLTAAGEVCAVVDATGSFDACTAAQAGVTLDNLLWVRCGSDIEKTFMAADYLIQAKGFGCIWLNLCGLAKDKLRIVPKTYWFRYRTRIKETPTLLLVTSYESATGSASQDSFVFDREQTEWSGQGKFKLLRSLNLKVHSQKTFYGGPVRTRVEMSYAEV